MGVGVCGGIGVGLAGLGLEPAGSEHTGDPLQFLIVDFTGGMGALETLQHLDGRSGLFVLADLERVDRGLPPYVGLSASLDAASQQAAEAGTDPSLALPLVAAAAGNWAGDAPSTLAADYDWLYVDGFGSGNESCSAPGAPGCWGHRDGILGAVTGLGCTDCVMGAGSTLAASSGWRTSFAEIVAEPVRPGAIQTFFTWQHDVLPYLHAAPAG